MQLSTATALALILAHTVEPSIGQDAFPPELEVAPISVTRTPDGITPSGVRVTEGTQGNWHCTFTLEGLEDAESVALAGDFNGWNPRATMMQRSPTGWSVSIVIPEGTRYYKFVVDGNRWLHDPANPERTDDGHGGANSLLRLGPEANLHAGDAVEGDGRIEGAALQHDPERPLYLQGFADGRTLIRYRTLQGDLENVMLVVEGQPPRPMTRIAQAPPFEFWEVLLSPGAPNERYTFTMSDGDTRVRDAETYKLEANAKPEVRTPEWAKDAIWYQVMVDRFRNGTPKNDPPRTRDWKSEWYSSSPWEGRDGQTFYEWFVFDRLYGGDLQGLEEKLDHLADLGVNAIYLNPIFQASGHHKYNTTNYLHVDENFGAGGDYARAEATEDLQDPSTWTWTESDRIFLEFLRTAKARGFKVIIDGVFNHVGTQHPAFRDVLEKGQDSAYADWFDVRSWEPFEYEGWAGFGSLPVFKKSEDGLASDEVRQHIFDVTRRWMDPDGDGDPSDGIDGWRLDVPNEIALPFWIDWCAHVRSINPDAYISGEIWDRADEWLDGRSFDAVMNYEFSKVAFEWLGNRERKITPTEADRALAGLRMAYPAEITYVLQNLIDSHDTDRAVSKLFNPDRGFDSGNREQDDPTYDGGRPDETCYQKLRLMVLLQMTYIGAPMVYYGDEVGMWGSDDPNNRKPMLWQDLEPYEHPEENQVSPELLEYYREVIALRNEHPALRRGSFRTEHLDDEQDAWIYRRSHEGVEILVALNAGTTTSTVPLPEGEWTAIFPADSGAPSTGTAVLEPLSGRVWKNSG